MHRRARTGGLALAGLTLCGWANAQAASAATAQPAPLPFRHEAAEPGFPVAGAVLLAVLAAATVGAWWWRHRRGGIALPGLAGSAAAPLRVTSSVRLDLHTRLHVVEWQGRQLLLAVSGTGTATVVDRIDPPSTPSETTP
jgi:hypothetical protein